MVNPTRARRRKRRIQPRENLRSRRPAATGPRSGWRKGDWPKGIRASKTRPGHCAGRARPVRWSGYVKQRDGIGRCGSPRSCTTSAALMAKAWCLWLGERSGLTGRLVFDGAGRSRTEQDGAGRSRTEQDGAGRSRTEQDGAGRSRTEQDGAGRSRTEQDGAGRSRTEQLTGYGGLCHQSSFWVCPTLEAATIPHTLQPSSTRNAGQQFSVTR